MVRWVRDNDAPFRATISLDERIAFKEKEDSVMAAKKWCKENNMTIWNDTLHTIRFTNARDLSWFLLRWS